MPKRARIEISQDIYSKKVELHFIIYLDERLSQTSKNLNYVHKPKDQLEKTFPRQLFSTVCFEAYVTESTFSWSKLMDLG